MRKGYVQLTTYYLYLRPFGTRCSVFDARCAMLGVLYLVLGVRCSVFGALWSLPFATHSHHSEAFAVSTCARPVLYETSRHHQSFVLFTTQFRKL